MNFERVIRICRAWASCGSFLICLAIPSFVNAELYFKKTEVAAGDIRGGMPVPFRFAFENKGDEVIEISGVQVSCGCLKPKAATRTFRPGAKGELLLEINPLSQSAGPHTWTAKIVYREKSEIKDLTLRISGTIIADVAVQPAALTVFAEHAARHAVTVTDLREKPMKITGAQMTSAHVAVQISKAKKDEKGHWMWTLILEPAADFPDGRFEEQLEIACDDPEYRLMQIPITLVKRPKKSLVAVPDPVELHGSSARVVVIRDSDDRPIQIDHVDSDSPQLRCQWSKEEGKAATVKVRLDSREALENAVKSAIHVHVSKPEARVLTIPITVDRK